MKIIKILYLKFKLKIIKKLKNYKYFICDFSTLFKNIFKILKQLLKHLIGIIKFENLKNFKIEIYEKPRKLLRNLG